MPDYTIIVFGAVIVAAIGFAIYSRSKRKPTTEAKPRAPGTNVKPPQKPD
jgi:hypothetical protein